MPEQRDTDALTDAVTRWVTDHWDPTRSVRSWWADAATAGWSFPSWPAGAGGQGLTRADERVVHEVFATLGVLGPPLGVAQSHGAPLVVRYGTAAQRDRLVPPAADGREAWCQLFSEPDAGSDLAGLRTTATRTADGWVVDGQKVWTSHAHVADRAILLARTDRDAPKHKGLSLMVLAMDQPGVEVRPIRQMNGVTDHFNEVFLTHAFVDTEDVIGDLGQGWEIALAALALERGELNSRVPGLASAPPGEGGGVLDLPVGEVLNMPRAVAPYIRDRLWIDADRLQQLALRHDRLEPQVRRRLADLRQVLTALDLLDRQSRRRAAGGDGSDVSANVIKLGRSRAAAIAVELIEEIVGIGAVLDGVDALESGGLAHLLLTEPSFSIAGGTDEIQLNVIAERGLGLPRDHDPHKGRPFTDYPVGEQTAMSNQRRMRAEEDDVG